MEQFDDGNKSDLAARMTNIGYTGDKGEKNLNVVHTHIEPGMDLKPIKE